MSLRIIAVVIAFLSVGNYSFATTGEVSGQIVKIRSHDTNAGTDWLQISSGASVGACNKIDGNPGFFFKDDDRGKRQFSLALTAYTAGKPVLIGFDDTYQASGYCYIRYINY